MGLAKEQQLREEEQGWSFTDQHVCTNCVDDYALEAAIAAAEDDEATCSFCGSTPAAELNVLLEAFVRGLRTEYGDADDEGVYYDGREGGYQWATRDTWDLIGDFYDVLVGDGLLDAIRDAMHDRAWVEVNFAHPRRDEALFASCGSVKRSNTRPGTSSGCATMRTRRSCAGLAKSRPVAFSRSSAA
jgi:HEPN/RES N-terminal domain 1